MTLPLQGSILHVTKKITAMTRKSTRKECCRELPVGARQCRASVGRSSLSFPAEWVVCAPVSRNGRPPLSRAAHCWMRTEGPGFAPAIRVVPQRIYAFVSYKP